MNRVFSKMTVALVVFVLTMGTVHSASAYHGHGGQGGGYQYGGYGHNHGGNGYYPAWHDTTHLHYHPGYFQPHGNHYHYVPGHYDIHRTGHWHW